MKHHQPRAAAIIMHTFDITEPNLEVVANVLSSSSEFEHYYCGEYETQERIDALLQYSHLVHLHERVYSLRKLSVEKKLADRIVRENRHYQIDVHKPLRDLSYLELYEDEEIQSLLLATMRDQIMEMQDLSNMAKLLRQYLVKADPVAAFNEFLPILTPEILEVFMDLPQPHYETLKALITDYMSEFENGPEYIIRNLLVLQACREICLYVDHLELAIAALESLEESLLLHSNDEETNYLKFLEELVGITGRTDIIYWSCLASLTLYVDALYESRNTHMALRKILSEGLEYLPPLYVQRVIARYVLIPGMHSNSWIQSLNPVYLPVNLRSLEERRTLWIGGQVMRMFSAPRGIIEAEEEWELYVVDDLVQGCLPTNLAFTTGQGNFINLGDWIINRAENIIIDGSYMLESFSKTTMIIIVVSWAYLIWSGQKLDFGRLFDNVSSWDDFKEKMSNWPEGSILSAFPVMERLRSIQLQQTFTLQEVRAMVDLGYNNEFEAYSGSGCSNEYEAYPDTDDNSEYQACSDGGCNNEFEADLDAGCNNEYKAYSDSGSDMDTSS
ncbi:hypothetical protein PSACC_03042 [Paramicrosporidium saccamoebae]|uniref:Uncharacterized protein n=1 Tax=Paramicrosporidium saccamoebae TaxID=1246581 RepID=A0A2H9THD3_9FUNG|nr:hypothetical protein PSACC_03042 [Paramicrosporidium saccamoebae]